MTIRRMASAAAALAAPALPALGQAGRDGYGYHHHGDMMMGWGGWIFGPFMMLLFIALIVGAVILAVRLAGGSIGGRNSQDRSLAILRERYAKGEIDAAEYEQRRRDLEGN